MARRQRYHLPGGIYHVMLRGNDGQDIFFDDGDRCKMCLLIQEGVERCGYRVLGFCFMSNHIHLAIQVGQINLSRIIQNLSFRYTRYINWKNKRIGHLFQGRYKSILVDGNRYAKELIRYIHLNPVRAGLVALPEEYRWSSHNVYIRTSELPWVTCEYLLKYFGESKNLASLAYQSFIKAGIGIEEEVDFKRGNYDGLLGDDDFMKVIKEKEEGVKKNKFDIQDLLTKVSEYYKVDVEALSKMSKNRTFSKVRGILALLVRENDNLTLEDLGKVLRRDSSGLSRHAKRLEIKSKKSEDLLDEILEIKSSLSQISECQA